MNSPISDQGDTIVIHVHVAPRASRTRAVGLHDGRVKIQVAAPPVDGEANAALIVFLARTLGVPKDQIALTTGATGKRKSFRVIGVSADEARAALDLD